MFLGWSSRTYPLRARELAALPDVPEGAVEESALPGDPVVMFIAGGMPDSLARGRAAVEKAGDGIVKTRIAFKPQIAKWNLLFTVVRVLRNFRRYKSSRVYHVSTDAVRSLGLERAVRTLDAPQTRGKTDRMAKMAALEKSLRENGYDDSRPINVMLCRTLGVEDSLRQGHHRISACKACGIPEMAVRFSAAGALPHKLARLARESLPRPDVLAGAVESVVGKEIAGIHPAGGRLGEKIFIVIPAKGGRFVLKFARVRRGWRGGSPGPAHAIVLTLEIAGRHAAVMRYNRGETLAPARRGLARRLRAFFRKLVRRLPRRRGSHTEAPE